jgi:hypothetical protein
MARYSSAVCGTLALRECERLSGRLEQMPFRSVGQNQYEPSISITCLSSPRAICVEPSRRMSHISTVGVRIGLLVNVRPLIRQPFRFELGRPNARSSQSQYSADCITFIGMRHDGPDFCALQPAPRSIRQPPMVAGGGCGSERLRRVLMPQMALFVLCVRRYCGPAMVRSLLESPSHPASPRAGADTAVLLGLRSPTDPQTK